MSYDLLIRAVAGVAAVAILGTPAIAFVVSKAKEWLTRNVTEEKTAGGTGLDDMRIVLDLASRLRASGCTDGVHLCQQLLDVMLAQPEATK
jgi:hypothetical protein